MQDVMPGVHHRFCVWHLWKKFSKQWKDNELKGMVWECARSTTVNQFKANMDRLKRKNEQAWAYLDKWPKEAWTKAYFHEGPKIDNICNNACEVFNAKIVDYRGKPILSLAEEVRRYIMRTMTANKLKLANYQGILAPRQQSRLEKEKMESNKWTPVWCGDRDMDEYEVHGWPSNMVVHLEKHTCTCRFWQLTGIPCMHAIATIAYKNERPEYYCHAWLTMGSYKATYEYYVKPLQGHGNWEQTDCPRLVPPPIKKRMGRPKKLRRKDGDEGPVTSHKVKRRYPPFVCYTCGVQGHTTRNCKEPNKRRRKAKGEASTTDQPTTMNESVSVAAAGNAIETMAASVGAIEIDLTQSHPPSSPTQPSQSQPIVELQQEGPSTTKAATRTTVPTFRPPPVTSHRDRVAFRPPSIRPRTKNTPSPPPMLNAVRPPTPTPTTATATPHLHAPAPATTSKSSSPPPETLSKETIEAASKATTSRLATFMRFVPTPGFRPPRPHSRNMT